MGNNDYLKYRPVLPENQRVSLKEEGKPPKGYLKPAHKTTIKDSGSQSCEHFDLVD